MIKLLSEEGAKEALAMKRMLLSAVSGERDLDSPCFK